MLKLASALRLGDPPSDTRTSTAAAVAPSAGVQRNTPVAASSVAPDGPLSSVQVAPGPSVSVAVSVSCSALPSSTVWSAIGAMTGGSFTLSTLSVTVALAEVSALPADPVGSPASRTRQTKLSAPV